MLKLAVLVSGGGSNLQAIIEAINQQSLFATIVTVIADRPCYGIERAKAVNIPTYLADRKISRQNLSSKIAEFIPEDCDLIVLAGFLSILNQNFIQRFNGKIINIHPSLLPKHGGAGMWGLKAHQAVLDAGDTESGCSVHFVTEEIDGGKVILQTKVDVLPNDTANDLQQRVLNVEYPTLIATIKTFYNENVRFNNE